MNLRERLDRCSLQELKNKIYRSAGSLARLNGNKPALVQRLLEMSSNMSAEEFFRIFPEMRQRPGRAVNSSLPPTVQSSSSTSSTRLPIRRPRINVVATSPSRSTSTRPPSSVRAPLEETPEQLLLR